MHYQSPQLRYCVALALLMAAGLCAAQTTPEKRTKPIRQLLSSAEVLALGEDPASGDFYRLLSNPHLTNADQLLPKGGAGTFYTSITGAEFRPRSNRILFNISGDNALSCSVGGTNSLAEAQLQLPHGATLQFLRIYGQDSSTDNLNVALLERCQPFSIAGNVTTTVLGSAQSSGFAGSFTTATGLPANTTIDNNLCVYSLRVQLADIVNGCAGGLLLDKARVQWIP
jgi:hypothetical protein